MNWIKKYWPLTLIIIVYIILLIIYFTHFGSIYSKNNGDWGTFGDFFGGTLSPLIGIISIILTYNIINNQSEENKQSEFKNIFQILFDSIKDKKDIIERKGKTYISDKNVLSRINRDIEAVYKYNKKQNPDKDKLKLFVDSFWSVYEDINGSSSPYMKVLHNCLKAIDTHCIKERQEVYSSLLRAQLHPDELVFIFYNAIASDNFKNFKLRLEKYSIMKDVSNYKFPEELKAKYNVNAFKENEKETKKIMHYNRVFSFEIKFTFNRK